MTPMREQRCSTLLNAHSKSARTLGEAIWERSYTSVHLGICRPSPAVRRTRDKLNGVYRRICALLIRIRRAYAWEQTGDERMVFRQVDRIASIGAGGRFLTKQ